ncbi:glycoside hydrolase family 3 protein [Mesorhizobium sp. ZMM04-5]|uniref:Glycoside hydrolase family 3 protein n=2 Tax=Mesorhizobium marinum TaxID=3228790 RepID=A0ABV3QWX1_9HYPH
MELTFDLGRGAEALGHRFLIGLQQSPVLGDHDKRLLSLLRPAGVVLFRANFLAGAPYDEWLASHERLLADVRETIGRDEVLVCIDHEGGGVLRPPAPVTPFAYAREWPAQAADVGRAMGVELRSLGFNVNFAPVVDVNSNPANPVIGPRSFGTTPDEVAAAARQFLDAMQAEGVLGCPKHFPGHGDAAVDSHYSLPVIDVDPDTLRKRELAAFRHFNDPRTRMIMTAHIVLSQVDPGVPATMSRIILQDILRAELGFGGVVVSDDLGMAAISSRLDQPETTRSIVNAGCDLMCMCAYWADTGIILRMIDHIGEGLKDGSISERTMHESFARVQALLSVAPANRVERLSDETFAAHASLAPLRPRTVARVESGGGGAAKI